MSNRFTEKAEKALNNASVLAEELGHTYIGSEHILLSLLRESDCAASLILIKSGISYQKLYDVIKEYSGFGIKTSLTPKDMTPRARKIVENSYRISVRHAASKIGSEHILLSILEEKECVGVKMLGFAGADTLKITDELLCMLRTAEKHFETPKLKKESSESALFQYGKNLTELARAGKIDPVIGRDKETERLICILCRKTKNNPCLIGEAGVGKTAIVEGLAIRIANGDVPPQIKGKSVISIDLTSMVAGAKYRGDFEERIKNLINEATRNRSVILFIDEIHTIVGAGSAEGAIDAANILKPQLSRAEIQLIGATTFAEYHKYIEKDAALERRFQALTVDEPTKAETIEILKGLRPRYERHHKVKISDSAIYAAVQLSERYIQERYFPDKAIDLIDEAAAKANVIASENKNNLLKTDDKAKQFINESDCAIESENSDITKKLSELQFAYKSELMDTEYVDEADNDIVIVDEWDIRRIITEMTGIPVSGLDGKIDSLLFRDNIKQRVIGQDDAIDSLIMSVMRSESGINNPDRPKGVFLFIGNSGVGKTELAKVLADELFHDKKSLIRYDMSEFSEKNSVTMLIGSPPGYIGYEEGGSLTEKIRRHPYSVVLFDEIEKAHREVLNLFLQIMDEGVLTDSCGRKVNFRNTYIIMTSNALAGNSEHNMGFLSSPQTDINNERLYEVFSPEFINRIDSIIRFSPLTTDVLAKIAENKLIKLKDRLYGLGVELILSFEVANYIAAKAYGSKLGARAVLRIITTEIENKISGYMLFENSTRIFVEVKNDSLEFLCENKKSPAQLQDSLG